MRTLTRTIAVVLFTLLSFSMANSSPDSDNALIGRARGVLSDCLQQYYSNPIYEVGAAVETTGICFVQGFLHRVTFYAGPKCTGNGPCPAFATRLVGTVDFGCEGEVIGSECVGAQ